MDLLPNNKLKKVALSSLLDNKLYKVVLFENVLKKVVPSGLEKVFTRDKVIDLISGDKVLFTLPIRVSMLLTGDVRLEAVEETVLVEFDKLEILVFIELT